MEWVTESQHLEPWNLFFILTPPVWHNVTDWVLKGENPQNSPTDPNSEPSTRMESRAGCVCVPSVLGHPPVQNWWHCHPCQGRWPFQGRVAANCDTGYISSLQSLWQSLTLLSSVHGQREEQESSVPYRFLPCTHTHTQSHPSPPRQSHLCTCGGCKELIYYLFSFNDLWRCPLGIPICTMQILLSPWQ